MYLMPIDDILLQNIQKKIMDLIPLNANERLKAAGVPYGWTPWTSGLSPSALYGCTIPCRKAQKQKILEAKWVSIKRWMNITASGIELPPGCYFSMRRKEGFEALPVPRLIKIDYVVFMFTYGNVVTLNDGEPITEDWAWTETDGKMNYERLHEKDGMSPLPGYIISSYKYAMHHPELLGIHLKKRKTK